MRAYTSKELIRIHLKCASVRISFGEISSDNRKKARVSFSAAREITHNSMRETTNTFIMFWPSSSIVPISPRYRYEARAFSKHLTRRWSHVSVKSNSHRLIGQLSWTDPLECTASCRLSWFSGHACSPMALQAFPTSSSKVSPWTGIGAMDTESQGVANLCVRGLLRGCLVRILV